MRLRPLTHLLLFSALTLSVNAAATPPVDSSAAVPAAADGPAKDAMDAFKAGRHAKAVELAKPLAEQGNADALYLMGFASETDVEDFFRDVPEFERMLVRSGIIVIKYWFSISDEEQQYRFLMRIHDPIKQWKLSPMDLQSRIRWEQYTKAKEDMFERTNIPEAPWYILEGNDKKRARLNCIAHLLSLIPYEEVPHQPITLPERVFDPNYERRTLPPELYVPETY
jgi:hypothetical protein